MIPPAWNGLIVPASTCATASFCHSASVVEMFSISRLNSLGSSCENRCETGASMVEPSIVLLLPGAFRPVVPGRPGGYLDSKVVRGSPQRSDDFLAGTPPIVVPDSHGDAPDLILKR